MPIQMKTNYFKSGACVCGLLAAAMAAQCAPLRRADVPADPSWVVHVDCDSLKLSAIGQYVLEQMEKPDAQAKVAAFQTIFNIDPRKQLHGLTLYSTGKAPEDGVLLVYADFEAERLVTLAKGAKDYQSVSHKQHTIHSWINEQKVVGSGGAARVYAAIQGERLVMFAQQEARVAQALEVLDKSAPSLAAGKVLPQLGAGGKGIFIQAAARKLDIPDSAPNAALLRMAKMARLDVGEAAGQLKATLTVESGDEEASKQMVSVGQGLIALMKLQQDNAGSIKLAEGLSLRQNGTGLEATLAVPTAQAIELMKAGAARVAERKANAL